MFTIFLPNYLCASIVFRCKQITSLITSPPPQHLLLIQAHIFLGYNIFWLQTVVLLTNVNCQLNYFELLTQSHAVQWNIKLLTEWWAWWWPRQGGTWWVSLILLNLTRWKGTIRTLWPRNYHREANISLRIISANRALLYDW